MNSRIAFIDNLRITANFLIVLNHAIWNRSLSGYFNESEQGIVELLRFFSMNLSPIRVPFFFLIAGLFATLYLLKKGPGAFTKTRAKRILLPLVVALFSYGYIVVAISRHQDITALWDWARYTEYIGSGFFGFLYVWFLYVLIIYSVVSLLLYLAAAKWKPVRRAVVVLSGFVFRNRYGFLGILLVLEAVKFVVLRTLFEYIPENYPFLPLRDLLLYSTYFAIGSLAGMNFRRFKEVMRFRWRETISLILAYALVGVCGYAYGNKLCFLLYSIVSNALPLVLLLSLFNQFLDSGKRPLRVVTNSAYTIYLIHFPVICLLSIALIHLGLEALWVYALVIVLAYPLSLAGAVVIRRIRILAFLFGAKPMYRLLRTSPA